VIHGCRDKKKYAIEEGRRRLEQASEDLKWARDLAERGGFHIACFLAPQVGEKAMKAFLYAQGEEIVVGHSIARLTSEAAGYDAVFSEKAGTWSIRHGYCVPTLFPNSLPDSIPARVFTRDAATDAVAFAAEVVSFIDEKINPKR
jgi:HEPN domain-containing protein